MRSLLPFAILLAVPARAAAAGDAGDAWIFSASIYGVPVVQKLTLEIDHDKASGTLERTKVEGTLEGKQLHLTGAEGDGGKVELTGTLAGGTLSGNVVWIDGDDPSNPMKSAFTARPMPRRPANAPRRHEFKPTTYYRQFSPDIKPVLTIWPGDTVHTTTVDAGGGDEKGVTRVLGGNPETGPFYVETAMPGDILAVHLDKVRLNRDWAISDDAIVGRALGPQLAVKLKDVGKTVRWRLDREHGVARPEKPLEHFPDLSVPLHPMLGCVGVAPGFASAPFPSGDSGRFGGNMDFSEVAEGATIYLPVGQAGALLYVGDGHALQGDGELNGNALETSMEVEFTVEVLPGRPLPAPRIESSTHIMALGLAGSLDDALKLASANMAMWLEQEYQLGPSEIAQVMGATAEIRVNEVADRNAGIVVSIAKARLAAPRK